MIKMLLPSPSLFLVSLFIIGCHTECLSNEGIYCSEDCKSLKKCIVGHEITINECPSEYSPYCNLNNRDCSSEGTRGACVPVDALEMDNSTVVCKHSASIPHPTDCTKYFKCPEAVLMACPRGKSFNIKSKQCDAGLASDNCQKGYTMEEGELGKALPLADDPNIVQLWIYTEQSTRLTFIQCNEGQIFSEDEGDCVAAPAPAT